MVPSEVLPLVRVEFMRAFQNAIQNIVPDAIEALFAKSELAPTSVEQRHILNLRSLLQDKHKELLQQLERSMSRLLDRSFATTYDAFRPSSALGAKADELSLLDSLVFENSLRFNEITQGFRNKAEQQLLSLNIRIAVLFGQDDIRERENPFRPYLFSRAIAEALESLYLSPEQSGIAVEQLGECLAERIAGIYDIVNHALDELGIKANLPLKINKAPNTLNTRNSSLASLQTLPSGANNAFPQFFSGVNAQYASAPGNVPLRDNSPAQRIAQLFQAARGNKNIPPLAQSHFPSLSPAAADASSSWLPATASISGVLRRAFGAEGNDRLPSTADATEATASGAGLNWPQLYTGDQSESNSAVELQNAIRLPDVHQMLEKLALLEAAQTSLQGHEGPTSGADFGLIQIVGKMHRQLTPDLNRMTSAHGEIRNLIQENRTALLHLASGKDEQMTIDIIAMLFEFIVNDSLVPADVRAQLGRWQFIVLQLALSDESLLTDDRHPARLLMNRIASVALSLTSIESSREQFDIELARVVKTLLRYDSEVPDLFSRILARFETFIVRMFRSIDPNVHLTIKAIGEAEVRSLRFLRVREQMTKVLSGLLVESYFQTFLESDWVKAICIADGLDARMARRFRLLVPDLLWSLLPKVHEEDREQLSSMLSGMLGNLRQGLELLAWSPSKQKNFLDWLANAHAKALRETAISTSNNSLFEMHERFERFTDESDGVSSESDAERETCFYAFLRECLNELKLPVETLDRVSRDEPVCEYGTIQLTDEVHLHAGAENAQNLLCGMAIDMYFEKRLNRGCVAWVNANLNNVIVRFDQQAYPMIINTTVLNQMFSSGRARFVEDDPIFDRAIHSLLQSADAMDRDSLATSV